MSNRWSIRGIAAAGLTLTLTLTRSRAAHAQSEQEMLARTQLLEQAESARQRGDHAAALEAASRAGRVRMTPSLRLFLAEEHAALTHPAEALANAEACIREVQRDGSLRNGPVILASCTGVATQQRNLAGQIQINVPPPVPQGVRVLIGGAELNDALYGLPYVVNPGTIVIEATAPGRAPFRSEVQVTPGAVQTIDVALAPASASVSVRVAPPVESPSADVAPTDRAPRRGGLSAGPFIVMGAGALSFGAAAVSFVLRSNAIGPCFAEGDSLVCPNEAAAQQAQGAGTFNLLTNVTLGVGAAALAAGGTWLVVSLLGNNAPAARRAALDVAPVAGGAIFGLRGSF